MCAPACACRVTTTTTTSVGAGARAREQSVSSRRERKLPPRFFSGFSQRREEGRWKREREEAARIISRLASRCLSICVLTRGTKQAESRTMEPATRWECAYGKRCSTSSPRRNTVAARAVSLVRSRASVFATRKLLEFQRILPKPVDYPVSSAIESSHAKSRAR